MKWSGCVTEAMPQPFAATSLTSLHRMYFQSCTCATCFCLISSANVLFHTSSAVYQSLTEPGLRSTLNCESLMASKGELPQHSACAPSMVFPLNWVVCATNAKINVSSRDRDMGPPVMWVVDKSYKNVFIYICSWLLRTYPLLTTQ